MRKNSIFNKEQVNKAILKVITNQFKKDCKNSHDIVEDAGYEIVKIDGGWEVKNAETGKYVYCSKENWRGQRTIYRPANYHKQYFYDPKIECKFDFVNCLDSTKTEYVELYTENKAYTNYRILKDARWSVDYEKQQIDKIQKEIARLQNELSRRIDARVRDELRLAEVKGRLGLAK